MNKKKLHILSSFLLITGLFLNSITIFADTKVDSETDIKISLIRKISPMVLPGNDNRVSNNNIVTTNNDNSNNKIKYLPKTNDSCVNFVPFWGVVLILFAFLIMFNYRRGNKYNEKR